MQNNITNLQHKKAHDLLVEYQELFGIDNTKLRLAKTIEWQNKALKYGLIQDAVKIQA